jgi:hypothetical protein
LRCRGRPAARRGRDRSLPRAAPGSGRRRPRPRRCPKNEASAIIPHAPVGKYETGSSNRSHRACLRVEMPVGRSHSLERGTLTMRRRTKPVPLARMDLNRLIRTLRQRSTSEWPRHVSSALEVLTLELKVDQQTALDLLIAAVSAAHRCASAVEQRALAQSRARARADVHKALLRIAKCAARSPAELRRSLDRSVGSGPPGIARCRRVDRVINRGR